MISVEIDSQPKRGLKIIRGFDDGRIIDVFGNNGVGKSSAALVLMISTGDYRFRNKLMFERFRDQIGELIIRIKKDDIEYKIQFTPSKWVLNDRNMSIVLESVGIFHENGNHILASEFRSKFEIKMVKGNETLSTQLEHFGDLISKKLLKLKESVDNEYQSELDSLRNLQNKVIKKIDQLRDLVDLETDSMKEYNNYKIERIALEQKKEILADIDKQLEVLVEWGEDNIPGLHRKEVSLSEEKDVLYEHLKSLSDDIKDLEKKIGGSKAKQARALERAQTQRDKAAKNNQKKRKKIAETIMGETILKEIHSKGIEKTIDSQEIKVIEIERKNEELVKDMETQNSIVVALKEIFRLVREIVVRGLGEETAFYIPILKEGTVAPKAIKFSFLEEQLKDMLKYTTPSNIEEEKRKLDKLLEILKIETEILHLLQDLQKSSNNLDSAKDNVSKIAEKLGESAVELKKQVTTLDQLKEEKENTNDNYIDIEAELNKTRSRISLLKSFPTRDSLQDKIIDLLNKSLPSTAEIELNDYSEVKRLLRDLKCKIEEDNHQIGVYDGLMKQIIEGKKIRAKESKKIVRALTKFSDKSGISLKDFIKKSESEMEHLNKQTEDLKTISNTIGDLIHALTMAFEGEGDKKSVKEQSAKDIQNLFNRFFVETYSSESFMKNVFNQYDKVKGFNLNEREIILVSNGEEVTRSLEDFSSGEKSYAYARAMMSIPMTRGTSKILVLDEFEALLDHTLTQDLCTFEETLINSNSITKIINIHPDKIPHKERKKEYERMTAAAEKSGDNELELFARQRLEEIQTHMAEVNKWRHYQIARY